MLSLSLCDEQAIICEAARIGGSAPAASSETRFLDPHSQQTFAFDHLRLAASDFAPFTPPDPAQEDARAQLDLHAETYVKNHYQNAAWSVFSVPLHHPSQHSHQPVPASENPPRHSLPHDDAAPDALSQEPADQPGPDEAPLDAPAVPDPIDEPGTETQHPTTTTTTTTSSPSSSSHQFKLYIVGNKYNPTNYWSVSSSSRCYIVCLSRSYFLWGAHMCVYI
jgi:capping protein alpha